MIGTAQTARLIAACAVVSGAVLIVHKAVKCDGCEMWIHNECSFMTEAEYENVLKSGCTWICPKCEFFNFSKSFFVGQLNLMNRNRFDPLTKENKSFSYQDTPPLRSFLVCILNYDKTSKIFSKCNHLFGRYLGETHFVHKSRAITQLKNKENQNVIG